MLVVTPKVEATAKDLLQYYRQRVKEAGFSLATKGLVPSSGFVTIYALLQICSHVSVYGFGRQTPEVGGMEPAYRYYDRTKPAPPAKETALTAMDVELAALRAMTREARLVLCMGNEPVPRKCGAAAHRRAAAGAREYGRAVDLDEVYRGRSKGDGDGGGGAGSDAGAGAGMWPAGRSKGREGGDGRDSVGRCRGGVR